MKNIFIISYLAFFSSLPASAARSLTLKWISDLDFGTVIQGDSSQTVAPGTSENSSNASFRVAGARNATYSIVLPSSPVALSDGSGHTVNVTGFQSNPSAGSSGVLGSNGTQMLFIGATLGTIPLTQPRGAYTGSFVVTVVYL